MARPLGKRRAEAAWEVAGQKREPKLLRPQAAWGSAPHTLGGVPPAVPARVAVVRGLQRRQLSLCNDHWCVLESELYDGNRLASLNF